MSHFANGYEGDTVSLGYILQTLEQENVLIPGVTENPNISVSVKGEVAYIYKRGSASIGTGTVGGKISENSTGVSTETISLLSALTFNDVIPHANTLVNANVVADRQIYNTRLIGNKHSDLAVTQMLAKATAFSALGSGVTLSSSNIYETIINDIKAFEVAHATDKMKPTGIVVGPEVKAYLLNATQFLRSTAVGDKVVTEGVIGSIAGLPVVYSQSMTAKYVILNAEGFGAPINVNTVATYDATPNGYPGGVGIEGEFGYGFFADASLIYKRA